MKNKLRIAVLGAGSWGTTIAVLLSENGHDVGLWEFFDDQAAALKNDGENKKFLPGITIPKTIDITSNLEQVLKDSDITVFVVPSHVTRQTAKSSGACASFNRKTLVVNAAKGLEEGTLKRMSEVLMDELPIEDSQLFCLIGPSHAEEVSRHMPTSVVVAGAKNPAMQRVQKAFFSPYFRVYTNEDLLGVEIAVALKNVIAIAAGVCDGLGYGDNTKAALLTRGLVEIARLGCAMGARRETFSGLAGIGDLIATCCSRHSRNRYVGERIGAGETLDRILGEMVMVAEGVRTAGAAIQLGKRLGVELPIIESTAGILFEGKSPEDALSDLMNRPLQDEMSWIVSERDR